MGKTVKLLRLNELSFDGRRAARKKRGAKIKDSLQKLLKTHVEKMSAFGSEQKLLKTKPVKNILRLC